MTPIPQVTVPQPSMTYGTCRTQPCSVQCMIAVFWAGGNHQTKLRMDQFGGVRGSNSKHFLVGLWQRALEDLDDQRAGLLHTSIDYSKAFDCLDFGDYLKSLEKKGECPHLPENNSNILDRQENDSSSRLFFFPANRRLWGRITGVLAWGPPLQCDNLLLRCLSP